MTMDVMTTVIIVMFMVMVTNLITAATNADMVSVTSVVGSDVKSVIVGLVLMP